METATLSKLDMVRLRLAKDAREMERRLDDRYGRLIRKI